MEVELPRFIEELKMDSRGLIPAIVVDEKSKQVLMMAYMNAESLRRTLESGRTWFYSRSRDKLWLKGETSGHFQFVKRILLDCDSDTLLVEVEQVGPACHEGYRSCFFREVRPEEEEMVSVEVILEKS